MKGRPELEGRELERSIRGRVVRAELALARTCVDDPVVLSEVMEGSGQQFLRSLPSEAARLFVSHCMELHNQYYSDLLKRGQSWTTQRYTAFQF
jgi:hypothetical protein